MSPFAILGDSCDENKELTEKGKYNFSYVIIKHD